MSSQPDPDVLVVLKLYEEFRSVGCLQDPVRDLGDVRRQGVELERLNTVAAACLLEYPPVDGRLL